MLLWTSLENVQSHLKKNLDVSSSFAPNVTASTSSGSVDQTPSKGLAIKEPTPLQSCRLPTDTWFMCPTGCEKMPYEKLFQSGQKFSKNVWQRWCDLQTSFRESLGIFGKWSKIFGKWSAMLVWPTRHLKCMTQKKVYAYLKGLPKYRRVAFFFLKYLFSF